MRDRLLLRRDGEGVARWIAIPVIFAVLALVATSLTFPWAASAEETTTSPSATTSTSAPANSATDGATSTRTTMAGQSARTAVSATQSPARPSTSAPAAVADTKNIRQVPQAADEGIETYALNPGIKVEITEILVEDGSSDEQIEVGDSVEVHGTWDARNANPKPGDEFTIRFPDELKLTDTIDFSLVGAEGETWGTCEVSVPENVMTCALSDAVTERPEEVHGSFYVYSKAVKYTTSETVSFTVNGETRVPGQLPGEGGIGDGQVIGDAKKTGEFTPDKAAVIWTIDVPGSQLAALDPTGSGSVMLPDALSDNMVLCDRTEPTLQSGRPGSLTPVDGGVTVTQADGAGSPIEIAITNGEAFDPASVYRVQYTTCTTSGVVDIPAEGEKIPYANTVTIGDDEVGEGIDQGWRPEESPRKRGSIDENSRYKKLDWVIRVPGTVAENAGNKVTVAEKLFKVVEDNPEASIHNHEVCDKGLELEVWMVDHLPGPDGHTAEKKVTDQFTITGQPAKGAREFTLELTPRNAGKFEPKKYYELRFRTCVTGDKIPDNYVTFTNTASVNGKIVSAEVSEQIFDGTKSGEVNLEPTEVNGEKQPAGTTVSYGLHVPGYDLEGLGLDTNAVITDTFSDKLAVCEVGNDLKKNLNLSVTARDFQSDEASDRGNRTADTKVERTGETLVFTLPTEEGGYSREIVYDIDYTLCTASGGMDVRNTVYENAAVWDGGKASTEVLQSSGGGGTGQGVSRGSFSLKKSVHGNSVDFPIDDTTFTVRVEEFAPDTDPATDKAYEDYEIEVKADGTPVSGVNARGTGWKIRLTEINLPDGNGVYFEPGKFVKGDGVTLNADRTQALITIQPKTNVEVELVNRAHHGTAQVTKTVVGDAAGELTGDEEFVVQAHISKNVEGSGTELREFTLKNGQFYDLGKLPIGTKVTFSEVQPANTDRITWSEPVIQPKSLVIGKDPAANAVSVTNEASITQGTFEVKKDLRGPQTGNAAVPGSFEVLATWTDTEGDPREKTLVLPANGTPVQFGENLPGGTKVTLAEVVPANGNGLAWGVPSYAGDVTINDAGSAVVTVGQKPGSITVGNFVDTNDGTLRLTKQVSGEAAEAASDAEFTVEARWNDGNVFQTRELTVTPGKSTPLGVDLPVGTEVTFTEVGLPEIAGVEWGAISWGTDPSGESWLVTNRDGTATGIVSDDPTDGRLITLTNGAQWQYGSVGFEKFIFDGDTPVPATEADLPEGAEFEVQIDGIDPALPAGTDFPAVGDRITLSAANNWSWNSGDVLPRNTVITFSEVDPDPLDGIDWARPFYYVTSDAGEPGDRNTVAIVPGDRAEVEIRNRPIPTTDVEIDKIVTGPKGGQVSNHESTTFQVTATWTDVDDEERSCILDVTPNGGMTPTAECDAAIVDGRVQFPRDTGITFVETGAHTDVKNVKWGDVTWSVRNGDASIDTIDGEPTSVVVTLTGDDAVTLELENETSSNGLIIIPLPIPLPPFGGGSSNGSSPDPSDPSGPSTGDPSEPGQTSPQRPDRPVDPQRPAVAGESGHNGAPGKPAPARPGKASESSALAVTGADVAWLGGAALALIVGGAWLMLRNRRDQVAE